MRLVIKKSECKNSHRKQDNLVVTKGGRLKDTSKSCIIVRLLPGQTTDNPMGATQADSKIIFDISNGNSPLF